METLTEIGKFIALFVGLTAIVYICGTAVAAFFSNRSEKNAEREIKEYFRKLRKN